MRRIISVLLENEPGALSRVVGLFSQRNYNIETLMLTLHQIIEEYAESIASRIDQGDPIKYVIYPPNVGFSA